MRVLSLFSCPVKFTMEYELNALRLLSSHVPALDVRFFSVLCALAIRVVPFIALVGR